VIALDASALIALLRGEKGADRVAARLNGAILSTVNLAEVLTKATEWGRDPTEVLQEVAKLPLTFVPVSEEHALAAALLRPLTRSAGLSLGDRLCLALALTMGCAAMTAESVWQGLPHGVAIELIR
jgi:ribonuclease VapC